jgi:hypothetical protein
MAEGDGALPCAHWDEDAGSLNPLPHTSQSVTWPAILEEVSLTLIQKGHLVLMFTSLLPGARLTVDIIAVMPFVMLKGLIVKRQLSSLGTIYIV